MENACGMAGEIRDIAPGLWLWDVEYPDWRPGVGWGPAVNSTCVESGGEVVLLDAMAPPEDSDVWTRLDERPPTVAVVLKPDHVRDVDLFVERYGVRAFGPWLFWRQNIPRSELEPIQPGSDIGAAWMAGHHAEQVVTLAGTHADRPDRPRAGSVHRILDAAPDHFKTAGE